MVEKKYDNIFSGLVKCADCVNYTVHAVRLVEKLSQETGLPVTDENLWNEAAERLGIR